MLILSPGQSADFEFIFNQNNNFYDPTSGATPSDVIVSVYRGDLGSGAIIDGPYSYLYQGATPNKNYIERSLNNTFYYGTYGDIPGQAVSSLNVTKFIFHYTVPDNLFRGNYSVVATTLYGTTLLQYTAEFQITQSSVDITSTYQSGEKALSTGFTPSFEPLEQFKTNSILLIGHADGLSINNITRIKSIQDGINLLNADFNSPLLRGIFDAYAAGARDIYICPTAPMKEYISDVSKRLENLPIYSYEDATPIIMNFYQRYYDRLKETYKIVKHHDYIDLIVPLEASIVNTGSVDFTTQLAMYCQDFHDETGSIQIGIIGSRNYGISSSDIDILEQNTIFTQKYTMLDNNNQIIGDMGRFIVPVYGEIVVNHNFLNISYDSSAAAAVAGLISTTPVNQSLIRKRLPTAYGLSGVSLKQTEVDRLDNLSINTLVRSNRSRRGSAYEIYLTNDNTLASKDSPYAKVPQIRLLSMITKEIMALGNNSTNKFSLQKLVGDVRLVLEFLKKNSIIRDFKMEAYSDSVIKGKVYFEINLTSTLGLRKIAFSIASGQGA